MNVLLRLTSPEASAFAHGVESVLETASGFVPEFVAAAVPALDRDDVTGPLRGALGEIEIGLRQDATRAPTKLATVVGEKLGVARKRASRSIGWPPPATGPARRSSTS